jgi:hypothetical protein
MSIPREEYDRVVEALKEEYDRKISEKDEEIKRLKSGG